MNTKTFSFAALLVWLPVTACAAVVDTSFFNKLFGGDLGIPSLGDMSGFAILGAVLQDMNWLALIWSVTKMAALFMLITIVILVFCRKKRFFKRQNPVWNKITYLYYLLIPLAMLTASLAISVPGHFERMSENIVQNGIVPVIDLAVHSAVDELPDDVRNDLSGTSLEDYLKKDVFSFFEQQDSNSLFYRAWNSVNAKVKDWLAGKLVSMLMEKALASVGKPLGFSGADLRAGVEALYKEDPLTQARGLGVFVGNILLHKVKGMIFKAQLLLLLAPLGVLLIPVLDTFIARRLERRQKLLAGAPA
jgi:hypothetical protein